MKSKQELLSYILSISILSFGNSQVSINPVNNLDRIIQVRAAHNSISYTIDFRMKWFSSEDTMQVGALVDLIRVPGDSLFYGWVSMDLDSIWLGYNGETIFHGDKKSSVLTLADPGKYPTVYIISTPYVNLIDEGFLVNDPSDFHEILNDSTIHTVFRDTFIEGLPCIGLTIGLPDSEDFYNQTYFFAFDIVSRSVRRKSYSVFFQDNEQYQQWDFMDVRYGDQHSLALFENGALDFFKKVKQYEPKVDDEDETIFFSYSQLQGTLLANNGYFNLKDEHSEYIILDFWYTSCYPCIKSIPALNMLAEKYASKNVAIYGVNPIDDEMKSQSRLEKFVKNNPMLYPTIMLERELKDQIGIDAYPTLMILNQNREVVFEHSGFSETLFEEVAAFLDSKL